MSHSPTSPTSPTRRKAKQTHARLDMSLFNPVLLRDEIALETAISILEGHLRGTAAMREVLLLDLLSTDNLLGFVFSVLDAEVYVSLSEWLADSFPLSAGAFESSLGHKLLQHISQYFWHLSYPSANLDQCHDAVRLALPALRAIATMSFEVNNKSKETADDEDDEIPFFKRKHQQSQRQRKKTKHTDRESAVDPKPFDDLQVEVPASNASAGLLASDLLSDQKQILQHYLEVLRKPHLAERFRRAYIPEQTLTEETSSDPEVNAGDVSVDNTDVCENNPSAVYPMVQPLKAALYFDSAEGFGEWRILISSRASRDLREMQKKEPVLFKIIVKKIKELSTGHFSGDNHKRLTAAEGGIPVYEAKMTRDSRLVYQIDCIKEFDSDEERQVIRIYGVYTHAQLERNFWDAVSHELGRKGKEYRKRCLFRRSPYNPGDVVFPPASFPLILDAQDPSPSRENPGLTIKDREELHSLLVLEKFVTFSQALFNSILADQDVAHVFDMSPQEQEIVQHPSSCYVLGRSGTGKTTTMLFKMLGIERTWDLLKDSYVDIMPRPRQLFVTQSRTLAEKVGEYFSDLSGSLAAANWTAAESAKLASERKAQRRHVMVDQDEEEYWRGDLPKKFSSLRDDHFPLFVTFDHLCRLLEADLLVGEKRSGSAVHAAIYHATSLQDADVDLLSNDYMQQRRASFVSYGRFLESYWIHFPQNLTKNLDPALVFAEFMGIIKGSEQTLQSPEGFLDKEAYNSLSHRSQATFANQREAIYSLFEAYFKQKRLCGEYDAADRTQAILRNLRVKGTPGQQVDFIYVDEAQDNLLVDALILRSICRNPDGLFWAGDTAQTISAGSSFRFNDLKAFLHRIEAEATSADVREPRSFQLNVNYRSHGGIVSCAHTVVQLITRFWPHAIDILAEERGIINGIKPIFFSGYDQDSARYEQFLFGASGSKIEFGAQQCILVRDDAARTELQKRVGENIGVIMTLYESKGLEYNDVLLYNFFADSPVDLSHWRVLLNAMPQGQSTPCPRFKESRHNGVCRELKSLYVAITRARKNLWIADHSDKCGPMKAIWESKDQIEVCAPDSELPSLAVSSSLEEWAERAHTLFDKKQYLQAEYCYRRASLKHEGDVAHAYSLREKARKSANDHQTGGRILADAFLKAAVAFWTSAEAAATARERQEYFRISAECYVRAGNDTEAARAYEGALLYTLCARQYRKAGQFDDAIRIITTNRDSVQEDVVQNIVEVAKMFYLKRGELEKAVDLFPSDDDAFDFMDDYGFDIAQSTLYELRGRYADAAELHLTEGRVLDAVRLFLLEADKEAHIRRAYGCILDGLWKRLSLGVKADSASTNVELRDLLRYSDEMRADDLDDAQHDQLSMFRYIAAGDTTRLLQLGERFYSLHRDTASALLCFDHVFSSPPKIQVSSSSEVASQLEAFLLYAQLLQKLASQPQPSESVLIRKLLAFLPSEVTEAFFIPMGTLLQTISTKRLLPALRTTEGGIEMSRWEIEGLIQSVFEERLRQRVAEENTICQKAQAFSPCLHHVVFSRCNNDNCLKDHPNMSTYDPIAYNARILLHLQQIMICQVASPVESTSERLWRQRYWLRQLCDALFPPYFKLGSPLHLSASAIPDKSPQIVKAWIEELLNTLDPYRPEAAFLTSFIRLLTTNLIFSAAGPSVPSYVYRTPCVATYRPPALMRGAHREYVVMDILRFMSPDRAALNCGVLFVKHVLEHRVPIDLRLLCDMLDDLCGALIVSRRLQGPNSTLHDITLPRSWLCRLNEDIIRPGGNRDTQLLFLYVQPMGCLLEQIYSGRDARHLLYENRDFESVGRSIKNVFITRICKNLCLFGYNLRDDRLRQDIRRTLSTIRMPGRVHDRMYLQYVTAATWNQLAKTVRLSTTASLLDEMIQLHEASRTSAQLPRLDGVRRIVYNDFREVPALLATANSFASSTSGLRAEATPYVPVSQQISNEHGAEDSTPLVSLDDKEEEPESRDEVGRQENDTIDYSLDDDAIDRFVAVEDQNHPTSYSEQEISAARVIQSGYRHLMSRRRRGRKSNAARNRLFDAFWAAAQEMEWPNRYYRLLYLGPLVHILLCLEGILGCALSQKKSAKKRLMTTEHLELEEIQKRISEMNAIYQNAHRLQRLLEPTSDLHQRRDLEALKKCVQEVAALSATLNVRLTHEWEDDLRIGLKGIVMKPKIVLRRPKPELNVEDEFCQ